MPDESGSLAVGESLTSVWSGLVPPAVVETVVADWDRVAVGVALEIASDADERFADALLDTAPPRAPSPPLL